MDNTNTVFLSYASPDRDQVLEFYDYLSSSGLEVWMDKKKLIGGQNWDFEIKRALEKATIIVVFLSMNSVDRRGYAQREIKVALDQAQTKMADDIYLIPLMLDTAPIPHQLQHIQVIRSSESDCKEQLANSIRHQLARLGIESADVQSESRLRWNRTTYSDTWDGLPGYDITYELLRFSSDEYPQVSDITDVIKGWLLAQAMVERSAKCDQLPDAYNFGQARFSRQNTWEASCGEPIIKERIVSVSYSVWWYGAGAAHPNHFYKTFVFMIDPVTSISHLRNIFEDEKQALQLIREETRRQLLAQKIEGTTSDDDVVKLNEEHVLQGTEDWEDFHSFIFTDEGIKLLFPPYQVAAFAFGPQGAVVGYDKVAKLMRKHYACALGVEYLEYSRV